MRSMFTILMVIFSVSLYAQESRQAYLERINKELPHQFKELKLGATLEAVRTPNDVQLYLLVDDVEQYEEVLIERSDDTQTNFAQCKRIEVVSGKFRHNYIEVVDRYPLSSKMTNVYRVKCVTPEGIVRMFAPVPVIYQTSMK